MATVQRGDTRGALPLPHPTTGSRIRVRARWPAVELGSPVESHGNSGARPSSRSQLGAASELAAPTRSDLRLVGDGQAATRGLVRAHGSDTGGLLQSPRRVLHED
ncbi:hypothetical protein PR202_ga09339 [Eleusine coracana subsp. coracana]|uniref:Uncharacterized protein n=1 Tax=Eleusine coracana subsp. coracana TaxID=191504 RepID=A0AAV5C2Q1_ELECO|nr:hypothetical protein PR202_ga09339 [Eleusine coracana subsp. coracana]